MNRISITLLALAACIVTQAAWSQSSVEAPNLLFMSGSIGAQVKKKFHTVEEFDGKRLSVKGLRKPIKITGKLNCNFQPEMVVTKLYAEIGELDFIVDSNAARLREMMAVNEMNAEQMRYEAGQDFESARARMEGKGTLERTRTREGNVAALDQLTRDQIEDGRGQLDPGQAFDNLRGSYSLVASDSMESAFAATLLTFDGVDGSQRAVFVRMSPVGDLVAGQSMQVKFDFELPELNASSVKLDFFLYEGKGEPIATNMSRGLQQLNEAQLEEFRAMSKKKGKK